MIERPIALSVVIANYNYAEYVGQAIESALAIDWPDVEVVVVDDGSTDGSRSVIESYGERIVAIFQANAGQIAARNVGFARCRGDAVVFLDSDDLLHPSVMREAAAAWHAGVSKVQFRMRVIDSEGKPLGSSFPQYSIVPTPAQIRSWAVATGSYPTPPCSGNLFARSCLEAIFPLDDYCGEAPDTCCIAAAPFLGEVITIPKPLADYRVHGRNVGAVLQLETNRLLQQTQDAVRRFEYAQRIARSVGIEVSDRGKHLSYPQLRFRVASFRLARARHPIAGDTTTRILADAVRATLTPQGIRPMAAIVTLAWVTLVLTAPRRIAASLVHWRLSPRDRPQVLRKVLSAAGVLRQTP